MGDKITNNISNNNGNINIGKNNKIDINTNDKLAVKSFKWQKYGIILTIIIGIISLFLSIRK